MSAPTSPDEVYELTIVIWLRKGRTMGDVLWIDHETVIRAIKTSNEAEYIASIANIREL